MEIGNKLKEAREAKGLTLEDVEEETKIRRKYIKALEDESFDILPGPVYAKAFLKTYTKFLEIDLGGNFNIPAADSVEEPAMEPAEPLFSRSKKRYAGDEAPGIFRRFSNGLAVVAGLALLLIMGSWVIGKVNMANNYTPDTGVVDNIYEEQSNPPEPPVPEQNRPAAGAQLVLELNIKNGDCWMLVEVDGSEEFQGTLRPGQTKQFEGNEKINVTFGNAGAVEAFLNGESLGLMGRSGEIKDREFRLQTGG